MVAALLRGGAVGLWGTVVTVSAVARRRFEMLDYAVSRGVNFIDTAEGTAVPMRCLNHCTYGTAATGVLTAWASWGADSSADAPPFRCALAAFCVLNPTPLRLSSPPGQCTLSQLRTPGGCLAPPNASLAAG